MNARSIQTVFVRFFNWKKLASVPIRIDPFVSPLVVWAANGLYCVPSSKNFLLGRELTQTITRRLELIGR
jgi:hypothetical protein